MHHHRVAAQEHRVGHGHGLEDRGGRDLREVLVEGADRQGRAPRGRRRQAEEHFGIVQHLPPGPGEHPVAVSLLRGGAQLAGGGAAMAGLRLRRHALDRPGQPPVEDCGDGGGVDPFEQPQRRHRELRRVQRHGGLEVSLDRPGVVAERSGRQRHAGLAVRDPVEAGRQEGGEARVRGDDRLQRQHRAVDHLLLGAGRGHHDDPERTARQRHHQRVQVLTADADGTGQD